jgi:mpaB/rubber oxygenase-like protein
MASTAFSFRDDTRIPGRVINLDQARVRHGGKADHMVRMLAVGDPLADAVILEMDALGKEGRRILNTGLADGLESLTARPPAITALLRQLETMPAWVDLDMLRRGEVAALSVSPFWYELTAIPSALVHTYASPAIARLLTQTGRLTTMAPRRLAETGMWARQAVMPGGLLRGAPGYQATVQVRLLPARIRSSALKHGWDTTEWGVPISQVDVARTWLDFTLTPLRALGALGIELTQAEQSRLYQYWHYIAYLLGLEGNSFYRDITDQNSAQDLRHLLDLTIGPPDENSRSLTAAMVSTVADLLASAPQPLMPRAEFVDLIHGILRRAFGDDIADQLGIPVSPAAPFLAMIALANSEARRWQTFSPQSAAQALQENTAGRIAVDRSASIPGGPTYQQHAQTGTVVG